MVPHDRMCTIGADHQVEVDLDLNGATLGGSMVSVLEPGLPRLKVGARQFVVVEECDVGHAVKNVQKASAEAAPVHGENGLRGG